jgi:hypothetical protein
MPLTNKEFRKAARKILGNDEHDVHDDAIVSRSSDCGAYVAAWVWVPDDVPSDEFEEKEEFKKEIAS